MEDIKHTSLINLRNRLDEIEKYKKEIKELKASLEIEKLKNNRNEQILEEYYEMSQKLKHEEWNNNKNIETIRELREVIEHYKKILDKFTINY